MQTTVSAMAEALEGLIADNGRRKDVATRKSAEASAGIPFGRMIAYGTNEDEAVLITSTSSKMAGISAFGQSYGRTDEIDTDGIQPNTLFDALQRGRIYVLPEADVTQDSEVHVRMVTGDTAEPAGAFGPAITLNALVYADKTFTAAATDIVTVAAHALATGDGPFRLTTTTTLPAGLALATDYYVIVINANTFYFASSRANALAGTRVDITDAGTGTHTMADVVSTKRVTSKNLSKLARWVKSADISEGQFAVLDIDMTKIGNATLG